MGAEAVDEFFVFVLVEFVLQFFEREVNDVMMMQFLGLNEIAKAQPQAVQEIDFVGGEVGRVRAEDFEDLVPGGHVYFKIELRLGIAETFPRIADLPRLFFALPLAGRTGDNRGGLQTLSGAKNTVPQFV